MQYTSILQFKHASRAIFKSTTSGQHVALHRPMQQQVRNVGRLVARRANGYYMMMGDGSFYSVNFLFVKEMSWERRLGKIQFLRSSHQQKWLDGQGFGRLLHALCNAWSGPVLALLTRPSKIIFLALARVRSMGNNLIQSMALPSR